MSINKKTRDKLLVEAQHRCTVCYEKCFEIHHIVEQAEGGGDDENNLIVMCPNCHQHRYHRSGEFTRDQLIQYKDRLREKNDVEKRLLQNLEEIKATLEEKSAKEINVDLFNALSEARQLVDPEISPKLANTVSEMATQMVESSTFSDAARKAIEIQYEAERVRIKASVDQHSLVGVDDNAYRKSNKFGRAYEYVLILDSAPSREWQKVFDNRYSNSFYNMKRETFIRRDRVVSIIADSDNLQAHVNWVKQLIHETNTWCTTQGYQNIDREINKAMREELAEFDAIESMKSRSKGVKI